MLEAVELPARVADLHARLADMNRDDLALQEEEMKAESLVSYCLSQSLQRKPDLHDFVLALSKQKLKQFALILVLIKSKQNRAGQEETLK